MAFFPQIEDRQDVERLTRNGTLAGLFLAVPVFGTFVDIVLRLVGREEPLLWTWIFIGLAWALFAVPLLAACFRITAVKLRFSTVPMLAFLGLETVLTPFVYGAALIRLTLLFIVGIFLLNAHRAIQFHADRFAE